MPENTDNKNAGYRHHDNSEKSLDEMVEEVRSFLEQYEDSIMLRTTCSVLGIGPYSQTSYSRDYSVR